MFTILKSDKVMDKWKIYFLAKNDAGLWTSPWDTYLVKITLTEEVPF